MTDSGVDLSFSFAIPAFDAEGSITPCLVAALAQTYDDFDVVVVDDGSTDNTRAVVRSFLPSGRVRLVEHGGNRGLAASRNSGVAHARGDVVVFLDADVTVPADFLERLARHYRAGGDAVAVESRVADQRSAPGRFQQVVHELAHSEGLLDEFSQAFSCRTSIARSLPFSQELPGCGADDVAFAEQLAASNYKLVRDSTLVVDHAMPTTVGGLWRHAIKRGRAVVHFDRHVRERSSLATVVRRAAASLRALTGVALVGPALGRTVPRTRRSRAGANDAPAFWMLHHVFLAGYHWGQLRELARMSRSASAT